MMKFFEGVDLSVMASIGIIALLCRRLPRIGSAVLAVLVSFALGALWGVVEGIGAEPRLTLPVIVRGVFLNSSGAAVAARLVEQGLIKAGLVQPMNGAPPPPPEAPAA